MRKNRPKLRKYPDCIFTAFQYTYAYFHREITYNQVRRYKSVNFYVIRKAANVSTMKLCVQQCERVPTEYENYNPVQSQYTSLWRELKELESAVPVRNVIRQILEYYFLQICGYEGNDLRKTVLEDNKEKFITISEDGTPDMERYQLASSMLFYIGNQSGISDGMHYVEDTEDAEQCKAVLKIIFESMKQEQHYKMMMCEE